MNIRKFTLIALAALAAVFLLLQFVPYGHAHDNHDADCRAVAHGHRYPHAHPPPDAHAGADGYPADVARLCTQRHPLALKTETEFLLRNSVSIYLLVFVVTLFRPASSPPWPAALPP